MYVPDFKHNLLSVGKLLDQNNLVAKFDQGHCFFQDLSTDIIQAVGKRNAGLYRFQSSDFSFLSHNCSSNLVTSNVNLFHAMLGHLSVGKLKHMKTSFSDLDKFSCDACILAKHHKLPFTESHSRSPVSFDLLHIDLWGPYRTTTYSGARYFLTIMDDHTRVTWTYLI